jgi:tetratricopeptide (TPR) repeat protein
VKQGRNEEAIRAYKRAIQLRPNSSEAYNKLGDAYFFGGRFEEAIASYKEAARIHPDDAEAYYNLGLAYIETGDRASALAQAKRLDSLDSELNRKLLAELQK